jgi:mannose-P-dolichol utilization defect 1
MEHVAKPLDAVLTPLRPFLKQITQNLPAPVRDAAISQLGAKCYRILILEVGPEPECLNLALSKVLGLSIIAMSGIVKLPQLIKILDSRSGAGLSFTALALETISFVVTSAYNLRSGNPFSTYGEAALIGAQNVAIGTAMLGFDGKAAFGGIWIGFITTLGILLGREDRGLTFDLVQKAMAGASALGVLSKVPQIWQNYQQGGTGQLSAFAVS